MGLKVYVRSIDASIDMEPVCGIHFCENCGECLHCNAEFGCANGGKCFLVLDVPPDEED
jgi:hypothetical protein